MERGAVNVTIPSMPPNRVIRVGAVNGNRPPLVCRH